MSWPGAMEPLILLRDCEGLGLRSPKSLTDRDAPCADRLRSGWWALGQFFFMMGYADACLPRNAQKEQGRSADA